MSACSAKIKQDLDPSLTPTVLKLPPQPTEKDYQHLLGICVIERKVLYKDILRIRDTDSRINKHFYEFWK